MKQAIVTLPGSAVAFVRGGGRDLELARLGEPASALPAGGARPFARRGRRRGRAGDRRSRQRPAARDGGAGRSATDDQRRALVAAGRARDRAAAGAGAGGAGGATYRLLHGAGDGVPGLACDVLGEWAVMYAYAAAMLPAARQAAEAVRGFAGVRGVVLKVRRRGGEGDATHAQEIVGATPPEVVVAHEHGVPCELHLLTGLNHGLFTDMREHRVALARRAAGKRVLNLFAYTGMLSLTCARAGAASVVSVDTAAGVNAWAASNFARSGLGGETGTGDPRWRFETGDAGRFLARAIKEGERYDLVLIDPPTHSPAKGGGGWVLERDYPGLIARAAEVIPDGSLLWLAANSPELRSLAALADKGLRAGGRSASVLELGGLPPDYPTALAQPRDRYLQTCLLRV
jgi:23S rRNA (cytosine1962-C5)-methyltransferase